MRLGLEKLQPLGRALMLPIAVLPIAALLLRLGQPDMLDIAFVAASGNAIFSNLGLLFAAGVAVGLARENHGAAALAGVVAYVVATEGAKVLLHLPPEVLTTSEVGQAAWRAKEISKLSVPAGILSGIVAGLLYNRFWDIKLPDYLAFFGGRRFVPIVAGFAGVIGAVLFGYGFPWFESGVDNLSQWVVRAGPFGLFLYGVLNRLLLITGLHHILNNIAWFLLGDFQGATGDLKRFFAGDPTAGGFMAGFFPVMMFGLPAACLAMYRNALPERRKAVGGKANLLSVDACMTRLRLTLADTTAIDEAALKALGARGIVRPGGNALQVVVGPIADQLAQEVRTADDLQTDVAGAIAGALQPARIRKVGVCGSRLTIEVEDTSRIAKAELDALPIRGWVAVGDGLQIIIGPEAEAVAQQLRKLSK